MTRVLDIFQNGGGKDYFPGIYSIDVDGRKGQVKVDTVTCVFILETLKLSDEVDILQTMIGRPLIFHKMTTAGTVMQVSLPVTATRLIKLADESMYHIQECEWDDDRRRVMGEDY